MRLRATSVSGAFALAPERHEDARGHFARTFCRQEFLAHGLDPAVEQCSVSFNHRKGTLRGMHFQRAPHGEAKLVRCTRGAIYDVIVDLRPGSATRGQRFGLELRAENGEALYVPPGVAHGFQTLEDTSEVFYQISSPYLPEAAAGYRYDDPAFGIPWPLEVTVISDRDLELPFFEPGRRDEP